MKEGYQIKIHLIEVEEDGRVTLVKRTRTVAEGLSESEALLMLDEVLKWFRSREGKPSLNT